MTALAHRIPRDASWVRGRSACPKCGTTLGVLDLVPLVSFAMSRGRCRHCGASIAWRYPITEVLCAVWAIVLFRHIGLSWTYPPLALWGFLLVALMWIDLDHQILPDALTLPGTLLGIAAALQIPGGAHHALLGVLLASGLLWGIGALWSRLRGVEAMGFGDVKLAAMFGVVLGWQLSLLTILLASMAGSIWGGVLWLGGKGGGKTQLPFGTLLCPSALVSFLWGKYALNAYLNLFHP